jgi:hypothetical protein
MTIIVTIVTIGVLKVRYFKTQLSAGKIIVSVFRDSEGVIHADFIPNGITISAGYYSNFLRNDLHQAIRKKRFGKPSKKIILLHNNAVLTKATVTQWARKS